MAKIHLKPIGSGRDAVLDEATFAARVEAMQGREAKFVEARDVVKDGWGDRGRARVHRKGKLTTWERLDLLKDADARLLPVGTLVNFGLEFGDRKQSSPGAGVVTAFTRVHGRWVMVIANDNTVASGAWWPKTPEKIQRAQDMALEWLLTIQDLQREAPFAEGLETLPTWDVSRQTNALTSNP